MEPDDRFDAAGGSTDVGRGGPLPPSAVHRVCEANPAPSQDLIASLPQRPPFLFVDEVLELEPGVRALAAKTFPDGDPIFTNHLPGEPLVPGVIVVEALAQASGLALVPPDGAPVHGYLAEVGPLRFRRLIRPGERILLEATLEARFGSAARFSVRASVGGQVAAEGTLTVAGRARPAR